MVFFCFKSLHIYQVHDYMLSQEKPSRPLPPQPEPAAPSASMTVIAEYDYIPMTSQDLELRKNEEYTILEKSDPNWWRARDKYGSEDANFKKTQLCKPLQTYLYKYI